MKKSLTGCVVSMFDFDISDELKDLIKKLEKKDRIRALTTNKKIKEVISNDHKSIDRYKNLRHELSDYKRVHIDKSFVLTFQYFRERKFVLFLDFDHHDRIYG